MTSSALLSQSVAPLLNDKPVEVRCLSSDTALRLMTLTEQLAAQFGSAENPALIRCAPQLVHALPSEVKYYCRPPSPMDGFCVLRGFDVREDRIGPTPAHWSHALPEDTAAWDILMILVATVMGRVFAWEGQQQGRFIHNILPIAGHEHEQTGASSTTLLNPHTEDAFHPARAHLMMLGCLRNPDHVATHASSIRHTHIDSEDYRFCRNHKSKSCQMMLMHSDQQTARSREECAPYGTPVRGYAFVTIPPTRAYSIPARNITTPTSDLEMSLSVWCSGSDSSPATS